MKIFIKKTSYVIYLLIVVMLLSEIVVRNAVNWIPSELIIYLPPEATHEAYKLRRRVQYKDSAIYHYQPFQKLNWHPHINIDENGFRNSVFNQKDVDTVILGDSITFAKNSKVDLGDLFRSNGVSALNLSLEGYGPNLYRDVYKKYVIDKGIKHNNVIVIFSVGNDFEDAVTDRKNLEAPIGKGKSYYPWIINLIFGVIENHRVYRSTMTTIIKNNGSHRITLPYREIDVNYLWWPPPPPPIFTQGHFDISVKAINDIRKMASVVRARVDLVILPSPASVYGISLYPHFNVYSLKHDQIVREFLDRFKELEIKANEERYFKFNIFDPSKRLANAIEKKFLYVSDSDAHFNTHGTKVFFKIINTFQAKINIIRGYVEHVGAPWILRTKYFH